MDGDDDGDERILTGRETGGVFSATQIARIRLPHDQGRRWRLHDLDRFYTNAHVLAGACALVARWQQAGHFDAVSDSPSTPSEAPPLPDASAERVLDAGNTWTLAPQKRRVGTFVAQTVGAARAHLMREPDIVNDSLRHCRVRRTLHAVGRLACLLEPHLAQCPTRSETPVAAVPEATEMATRIAKALVRQLLPHAFYVRLARSMEPGALPAELAWGDDALLQEMVDAIEERSDRAVHVARAIATERKSNKRKTSLSRPVARRAPQKSASASSNGLDSDTKRRRREEKQMDVLVAWIRDTLDAAVPSGAWLNAYVFDTPREANNDEGGGDTDEGALVLRLNGQYAPIA